MEKLKRELEEKMAEVMRIKATLQSSETVSVHLSCGVVAVTLKMSS